MQPLRIAFIRQRYSDFGGAEQFLERAMNMLQQQGAEITLITRRWRSNAHRTVLNCDPFYIGSLWRDWGFSRSACRLVKSQTFDIIQSHERLSCCDIYRAGDGVHHEWLNQRSRVLSAAGRAALALNPYHAYVKAAERRMFENPQLKAVICNSQMVRQELVEYFDVPLHKLHVIYSGIDSALFHPQLKDIHNKMLRERLAIPADAPLFLFVGSGFERKGLAALLQAFAHLPDQARLMVVGRDKKAQQFHELARQLGITERVYFLGGQPDVKPYYGAADALILPTLYDPFPNAALEAMACALPVVTSYKSGAAELIKDAVNGWVCDALDVTTLARHMTTLLDPAIRVPMALAARETVAAMTLENMATQLAALYREQLEHN